MTTGGPERSRGRWLLLPAGLCLPFFLVTFGVGASQEFCMLLGMTTLLGAALLGGVGIAIDWVRGRRRWPRPRQWRARWWWLATFAAWLLVVRTHADVRLWLWWTEAELEHLVEVVRSRPLVAGREVVDGRTVSRAGSSGAVLFHSGALFPRGVAWDPQQSLAVGDGALPLREVVTLRGPWRYWVRDD